MIGNQWAESGAGKRQHDKDVAEERRVLAEAAIKEKADQDRETVSSFLLLSRELSLGVLAIVLLMSFTSESLNTHPHFGCYKCLWEKGQFADRRVVGCRFVGKNNK